MAGVDIATLGLRLDSRQFRDGKRDVDALEKSGERTEKRFKSMGNAARDAGKLLAGAFVTREIIKNSIDAQRVNAQLQAVIESTGGAAERSFDQIQDYASALQQVTNFSDEATKSTAALLLTFTQIRGEIFDRTLAAVTDMATAMGGDLKGSAIQVGKALNDPILGVTALTRVGVQFTVAQREVIKTLVETNQVAEAQKIILLELETQFGGSAAAARDTLGGALIFVKNQWADAVEVSRESSDGMIEALESFGEAIPGIREKVDGFFNSVSDLGTESAIALGELELATLKYRRTEAESLSGIASFFGFSRFADEAAELTVEIENQLVFLGRLRQARADMAAENKAQADGARAARKASEDAAEAATDAVDDAAKAEAELAAAMKVTREIADRVNKSREQREAIEDRLATQSAAAVAASEELAQSERDLANTIKREFVDAIARARAEVRAQIREQEDLARAGVQVAEVIGLIGSEASRQLQAVVQFGSALKTIRAGGEGALSAGLPGLIGGGLTILGGLFGGDGADEAAADRLEKTMERLAEATEALNAIFRSTPAALTDIFERALDLPENRLPVGRGTPTGRTARRRGEEAAEAAEAFDDALERITENFRTGLQVRLLVAQGQEQEAARLRLRAQQEQEIFQARQDGWDESTIAALEAVQAEETLAIARRRAAEQAREFAELQARALSVLGQDASSERLSLGIRQAAERERASEQSSEFNDLLLAVQGIERVNLEIAIETREARELGEAQLAAIDAQLRTAQDQLRVSENQLREAERAVESSTRIVSALSDFRDSLLLGPTTTLSPTRQLDEARSQFGLLQALASGGDVSAAEGLPRAAQALLDASREVNASGEQFVADFNAIQDALRSVEGAFGARRTVDQQILAELQIQSATLTEQIAQMDRQRAAVEAETITRIQLINDAHAEDMLVFRAMAKSLLGIERKPDIGVEFFPGILPDDTAVVDGITVGNGIAERQLTVAQSGFQQTVALLASVVDRLGRLEVETRRNVEVS